MKAVIMAGGEGIRLRPFTYMIPKPLLPIKDITVLEHTIIELKRCGFDEIFISTNYQAKQFEKCLTYGKKYEVIIHLITENKKMGTAGSLYLIAEQFTEPICVVNGDLIIKASLDEMFKFHIRKSADVTVGIKRYNVKIPYAIISKDDERLLDIKEKPIYNYYIGAGIYILSPSVLKKIDNEQYLDMPMLINNVKSSGGSVLVYDIGDYWLDIGQVSDYERAIELIEKWEE